MSRRTRSRNAYESQLNGAINNSVTTFPVNSAAGLTHPLYLVIDPEDPAVREYIKVGNVTGNTFNSVTRGLPGSVGGVGQAHANGATVRAVPVHQWLDDIFDDIEALEAADAGHIGGTDTADHPEATGSVRGFMSAADKTKLNALDTGQQVTNGNTHDHAGGDGAQISHAGLSNLTTGDPHTQYLKEEASGGTAAEVPDHTHASGAQAGTVAHSVLTGLTSGDPHTQYILRSEARHRGAQITKSGTQNASTGVTTTVSWETVVDDDGGYADLGNDRLTVPAGEAGYYVITAQLDWADATNPTVGNRIIAIQRNAITIARQLISLNGANSASVNAASAVFLDEGDDITVTFFQASGGTLVLDTTSYLSMVRQSRLFTD